MEFSLVICTYRRAIPLLKLLKSIQMQVLYPNEIIIVDGSEDEQTKIALQNETFQNLNYFQVENQDRGLTRQRNFGISKVKSSADIVCFLDDDTVLESDYFEQLISTYTKYPHALAVGGYIANEIIWEKVETKTPIKSTEFYFDGWKRTDGSRFVLRKKIGLDSDVPPGFVPKFSHGRSVGFLPPSDKIYETQQLMGGVSSFKKSVFDQMRFSTYFEGYGLYEDADFTLRVSEMGKLYVNTNAKLAHYHDVSGRPNKFKYGKMVVRNGWYVWRVKNLNPNFKDRFKWHSITILLTIIRFSNVFNSKDKMQAFDESLGRFFGWLSLIFNKPKS